MGENNERGGLIVINTEGTGLLLRVQRDRERERETEGAMTLMGGGNKRPTA